MYISYIKALLKNKYNNYKILINNFSFLITIKSYIKLHYTSKITKYKNYENVDTFFRKQTDNLNNYTYTIYGIMNLKILYISLLEIVSCSKDKTYLTFYFTTAYTPKYNFEFFYS